jgi:TolB protein
MISKFSKIIVLLFFQTHVFSQQGYELLMTSLRTGDTEIFATNPVTGDTRNISRSPLSEDRYPAVSADGKKILFTSNRGKDEKVFEIYMTDPAGNKVEQITFLNDVCYFPSFSADGKTIVFGIGNTSEAGILDLESRRLKRVPDVRDPNVSPDGKMIVFTRKVKSGFPVFTMDINGGNVKQITLHESELGGVGPVFSPDGSKIIFSDDEQGKEVSEIYTVNTDGSNLTRLTKLGRVSNSACYSPDGKWITFRVTNDAFWQDEERREAAYKNKEGEKRPVWMMKADGTEVKIVQPLRFQCGIDGSRAVWRKIEMQ